MTLSTISWKLRKTGSQLWRSTSAGKKGSPFANHACHNSDVGLDFSGMFRQPTEMAELSQRLSDAVNIQRSSGGASLAENVSGPGAGEGRVRAIEGVTPSAPLEVSEARYERRAKILEFEYSYMVRCIMNQGGLYETS